MHLGSGGRKGLVSQPQTLSIHAQTFRHIRFVFNKAAKVIIRGCTFCILIINVVNALLFVAKWVGEIDYAPPDIQFGDATFRGYSAPLQTLNGKLLHLSHHTVSNRRQTSAVLNGIFRGATLNATALMVPQLNVRLLQMETFPKFLGIRRLQRDCNGFCLVEGWGAGYICSKNLWI